MICAGNTPKSILKSVRRIQVENKEKLLETFIDITDRKQAEAALLLANQRFSLAAHAAQFGVWELVFNGNQLIWDDKMYELYGVSRETFECNYESWQQCVLAEDIDRVIQEIQLAHAEEQELDTEFRIIKPDRTIHFLKANGLLIRDDQNEAIRMIGINYDITERKQMEETIRAERDLFSAGPVFTIVWDIQEEWPVKQVSSNVTTILGYTPQEMMDGAFRYGALIHPEDMHIVIRNTKYNIEHHIDEYEQSYRVKTKENGYRWFYDFTKVDRDSNGQVVTIRGYLFDQTHQKELENSLQLERQRLSNIIEGTHVGTWEWHVPNGETTFNERWAEMVGYTLDELSPISIKTWERLVHPDDLIQSNALLEQHFRGERDYYEFESRMKHKDGQWIWVLDRGKVTSWAADGSPVMMQGTHQEITERKLANEALQSKTALLEAQTNAAIDGILVVDPHQQMILSNQRMIELFSIPAELLEDENKVTLIDYLVHQARSPRHFQDLISHLQEHPTESSRDEVEMADGSIFDRFSAPVMNQDGKLLGRIWTFRDITDRKNAEQALTRSEVNFRTFFETISDLIIVASLDGQIQYTNHAVEQKLGWNTEEIALMHILDLYPIEKRDEVEKIFAAMLQGERGELLLPPTKKG